MDEQNDEKNEQNDAPEIGFIEALSIIVENLTHRKGAKKYALLHLIASHYKTDDDIYKITSLPIETLVKEIYFPGKKADTATPKEIKDKRKSYSSLKSSLNKNLRTMAEEGLNPLGIVVGKTNVFNISQSVELERKTESIEKDITSDLQDILSKEGVKLKGNMAEKLKDVIHKEFSMHRKGIEKIEEKMVSEKANKQLKKKLRELRTETSSLKKEIDELKVSISDKEDDSKEALKKEEVDQKLVKEIEDKLRASIEKDIENHVKALGEKDKEISDKENRLSDKENEVLQLQREMSEKELAFREDLKKEKETLENRFREEKDALQKKTDDLQDERIAITGERDELLDEKVKMLDNFDQEVERIQSEKARDENANQKEWKELTGNMAATMKGEKELFEERDYQRRGFATKEENIQTMAAEQIMASMEINETKTNLEKEKEEFRQELNKKYEEEKEKLRAEMKEEFESFKNEQEQLRKGKEVMLNERKSLREKEKVLPSIVEKIVNKKLAARKEELSKKEKRLDELQKKLEKEEGLMMQEKSKLVNEIKAGIGGKTSLLKLRSLVKEQEMMLSAKQKLRKTEESLRENADEEIKNQKSLAMEEVNSKKKILYDEEKRLDAERNHLNQKETLLSENKNKVTEDLTKKYEELMAKKEKEFAVKEEEWHKKVMEFNEKEAGFLKKQEDQLEQQKKISREMTEKEEEVFNLMQESMKEKEQLVSAGKMLSQKTTNLEQSYSKKLRQVNSSYQQKQQILKKKNDALSQKAERLKDDEMSIVARAERTAEEIITQLKAKQEEMERKESQLVEGSTELNRHREELQKTREEVEKSRGQAFDEYKNKIDSIDDVIHEKIKSRMESLMKNLGSKGKSGADLLSGASEMLGGEDLQGGSAGGHGEGALKEIEALAAEIAKEAKGEGNSEAALGKGASLTATQLQAMEQVIQHLKQEKSAGTYEGGESKDASEMSSSAEGTIGDYGDKMELAAPPRFEKSLSQDYGLTITLPTGEFLMGNDEMHEAAPRHKVKIERPFRISKYPVTVIQFLQFANETGYLSSTEKKQVCGVTVSGGDRAIRDLNDRVVEFIVRNMAVIDDDKATWRHPMGTESIIEQKFNHPVTMLTWWDCMSYCDWLSEKSGTKCRLPTEKEWEYTASNRGQLNPGEYYWGVEEMVQKHCNSQNSYYGDTTAVDCFPKNGTIDGIRDLLGNVWEWTSDSYRDYPEADGTADQDKELMVARGGSYAIDKEKINFCIRRPYKKLHASSCIGFRVVSEV